MARVPRIAVSPENSMRELDALQRLKARYCRFLDAKDWPSFRSLFTDDFVSDTTESGGRRIVGADAFVKFVRDILGSRSRVTVHQVHAPEVEFLSETAASGIWAMQDVVRLAPGLTMRGYGHYHETYERTGDGWRIKSSKLTRLRMDLVTPIVSFSVPLRFLRRSKS